MTKLVAKFVPNYGLGVCSYEDENQCRMCRHYPKCNFVRLRRSGGDTVIVLKSGQDKLLSIH